MSQSDSSHLLPPSLGAYAPTSRPDGVHAPKVDHLSPSQMEIYALARRCKVENERFALREEHDTRFEYEMFRRALVERNETAWEYVYSFYQPLVSHWVRRNPLFGCSGESIDALVSISFTRFWRAMLSKRFGEFPTLASLLTYLRLCAGCAVIDGGRSRMRTEQVNQTLQFPNSTPPDEEAYARVNSEEFWRFVNARLRGEAEREVVLRFFLLEMKPGDIYDQCQDLFASVKDVYRVKRNVLVRLGRDEELQQMK